MRRQKRNTAFFDSYIQMTAHQAMEIAALETIVKKEPLKIVECCAAAAKVLCKDSINIPVRLQSNAIRKAFRRAFPGVQHRCNTYNANPILRYGNGGDRETIIDALYPLTSREGNQSDSMNDYFDFWSRMTVDGVSVHFATVEVWAGNPWDFE